MNQPNYPDDPMRVAPPYCAPGEREPEEVTQAEREAAIAELIDSALTVRLARSIYDCDGRTHVAEALVESEPGSDERAALATSIRLKDDCEAGRCIRRIVTNYLRLGAEKRADEHIERRRQRAA